MKAVCVDFDRVLHQYEQSVGQGYEVAVDPPVEGARELLEALAAEYEVIVHTARANTWDGRAAVWRWLREHELHQFIDSVQAKPEAVAYIDDRAILAVPTMVGDSQERRRLVDRVCWLDKHGAGS